MIEFSKTDQWKHCHSLSEDDLEIARRIPLLAGLPVEVRSALLSDAHIHLADRNEVLFVRGETSDRFYLILDGWIKLTRQTPDGNESIIGVNTKGDTFAEAVAFSQSNFPVTAVAVSDARLLIIPAAPAIRAFKENSELALNVVASMSKQMRALVRQIEQLSVKSTTERVANFLLRLCPEESDSAMVSFPVEKSLVAGRLGMQPETLSRALAKLRKSGVVTRGNHVHIADVETLRELCSDI